MHLSVSCLWRRNRPFCDASCYETISKSRDYSRGAFYFNFVDSSSCDLQRGHGEIHSTRLNSGKRAPPRVKYSLEVDNLRYSIPNTLIVALKKTFTTALGLVQRSALDTGLSSHGGCLGAVRNQRPLWGVWRAGTNSVTEIHSYELGD